MTLDVSDCKEGTISWMCCRASYTGAPGALTPLPQAACRMAGCDGTRAAVSAGSPAFTTKCEGVASQLVLTVAAATTHIDVQMHDPWAGSNVAPGTCPGPTCCGGDGGAKQCGTYNVCTTQVSLGSCPTDEEEDGGGVGGPSDPPACTLDCSSHALGTCRNYKCGFASDGTTQECQLDTANQFKAAGAFCASKNANLPCDADDT